MTTLDKAPGDASSPGAVPTTQSTPDEPGRARGGSPLVIAARVLLLLVAVAAVAAGLALSRARERAASSALALYVCPMHPEARAKAPGECPICGMALERADRPASVAADTTAKHGALERVTTRLLDERVQAPAWVGSDGTITALLYRDDLVGMGPGLHALFYRSRAPAAGLPVHLAPAPPSAWDASSSAARFLLDGKGGPRAAAGDVGWVELTPRPRELPVVPWSAVLYSPQGPYVLVPARDQSGSFSRRGVEIGRTLYARAEADRLAPNEVVVLSGLHAGEAIVAADAFVSDAQRRLSTARGQWEGVSQ